MVSVAVVIVTFNSSRLIGHVLQALARQTVRPARVLVIDNGSADAEATAAEVAANPGVELLRLPENCGFAAANNRGIALCGEADFIALLNPDAFPQPAWLARLLAAAAARPEAASFASRLLRHDNPLILDGAGDRLAIDGKPRRRGHGLPAAGAYLQSEPVFCACAAAALYRRSALAQVGGFDEDYFCYLEDVDLGFRLQLAGYSCLYVPDAVAHHIGAAASGDRHSDFAVYHGHRNLVWTYVKNMPGALFWLLLPGHLLLNAAGLAYFALRGKGRLLLKAKIDAIAALPRMWQKRRAVQSGCRVGPAAVWRLLDKDFLSAWRERRCPAPGAGT